MEFQEFLRSFATSSFSSEKKLICFSGTDYPLLFFSAFFKRYKLFQNMAGKKISFQGEGGGKNGAALALVSSALSTSFLGTFFFYWLADLTATSSSLRKDLLTFLKKYEGGHAVGFFLQKGEVPVGLEKNALVIELPEFISLSTFNSIWTLFASEKFDEKRILFEALFSRHSTVTLDQACLLVHYVELLSVREGKVGEKLLDTIFEAHLPLSALSQAFFSKKPREFFEAWSVLAHSYPDVFWVTFWQEQLWRAYHTRQLMEQKQTAKALRVSYRLPSHFIKTGWQKFSLQELHNSFQFIYEIDFATKTGSNFCVLDMFYSNYFLGKFAALKGT